MRILGTGGMASVYLGHRIGPTGAVQFAAIKVMLPHLIADEASVEMFLDEARTTSAIHHPYVCRVLDFGVDDGLPYLAMDYVCGETLSDLMDALHTTDEGRVAAHTLIPQVIIQACEGLHAAHEACDELGKHLGIVHRDMAPQNIVIGYDGCVRLLDFGIARSNAQLHKTQHGVFKGRFAYMAPEQMESAYVDRRADVWSLGVMLWEGVAGQRLFKRSTVNETMRAVIADSLPSLLCAVPSVPPKVLRVVERSVTRDVSKRFPSARRMGIELSSSATAGSPQVAAWMQRLFGQRLEAKRRELRRAAGAEELQASLMSGAYRAPTGGLGTESGIRFSTRPPTGSTRPPTLSTRPPTLSTRPITSPVPTASPAPSPPPARRWAKAWIAGAAVLTVTSAVVVIDALREHRALESAKAVTAQHITAQAAALEHASSQPGAQPESAELNMPVGTVMVRSTGVAATVQIDGRDLGQTPVRIALAPGRHLIRLSGGGDGAATLAPIDVEAGKAYTLDVPVEP
jgi:serine/threonine-protein kinase